jgi:hypothetical protein
MAVLFRSSEKQQSQIVNLDNVSNIIFNHEKLMIAFEKSGGIGEVRHIKWQYKNQEKFTEDYTFIMDMCVNQEK